MLKRLKHLTDKGFTITELMIALTVLSTLLLLSTMIMIQIGTTYSKGVNSAKLQNATRNLTSEISATLQFSGTAPAGCRSLPNTCYMGPATPLRASNGGYDIYAYCVNDVRYSYVMNREQGKDTDATVSDPAAQQYTPHVMWRDTLRSPYVGCKALDISKEPVKADDISLDPDGSNSKGHEMVPSHARLTRFVVSNPSHDPVTNTYEDANAYTLSIGMAFGDSDLIKVTPNGTATCKSGSGSEYCAISQLTTTVKRRVAQ